MNIYYVDQIVGDERTAAPAFITASSAELAELAYAQQGGFTLDEVYATDLGPA